MSGSNNKFYNVQVSIKNLKKGWGQKERWGSLRAVAQIKAVDLPCRLCVSSESSGQQKFIAA